MRAPSCPNCRERLSSAELGFNGLWSCLYCEGVWLPFAAVEALARDTGLNLTRYIAPDASSSRRQPCLTCPKCQAQTFISLEARDVSVHSCSTCRGLFIPKVALNAFAGALGVKDGSALAVKNYLEQQGPASAAEVITGIALLELLAFLLS